MTDVDRLLIWRAVSLEVKCPRCVHAWIMQSFSNPEPLPWRQGDGCKECASTGREPIPLTEFVKCGDKQ
jgi:hypothetical protein